MAKSCKYYKQQREISYDGGVTWIPLDEYQKGVLIEVNSSDCTSPSPKIYRWTQTEDTVCVENLSSTYTKYYVYKRQVSTDNGQTWTDVYPLETKPYGSPIGTYDTLEECEGIEPQYRWVNLNPSVDYYCNTETHIKYFKQQKQVSIDGGTTWTDVVPAEYQQGGIAEEESTDCGYVPPTPTASTKFIAHYSDSTTYSAACDSTSAVTTSDTRAHSTSHTAMTEAIIGDCVTSIGIMAFQLFPSLTSVTIGNNVTSIGEWAFEGCSGLTSISLPNSVTTIERAVFSECYGLTSITIPTGVTSIEYGTFYDCTGLTTINIPNSVTSIGNSTFYECYSLTSVGASGSGADVELPTSITSIEESVFHNCTGLTTVTIPNNVTSIGDNAFHHCYSLTSVTIPNSVTTIGDSAFVSCSGLTRVNSNVNGECNIPNGITSIGEWTFSRCYSLTSINLPSNISNIASYAFYSSSSLTSVTVEATTPPTLGSYVFYGINNLVIYVPSGSVNTYKSASGWSTYSSRIQAIP